MVFGEIDWIENKPVIRQHTAMSISWLQAKILQYFLNFHVAAYEMVHGPIPVPSDVIPPPPNAPTGDLANNPTAQRIYEHVKKLREEFIASLGKVP
ncbi:MAG TPA: hypothetical protein VEF05_10875, partial [Terriglobales bacterium]|nr:hypothetical protein [Terriglobales bacterium]